MKAQRRHQLQTNSLSQAMDRWAEFLRQHGSRVLLGAIFVVLLIILIYQRIGLARERAEQAQTDLSQAWEYVAALQNLSAQYVPAGLAESAHKRRQEFIRNGRDAIGRVQKESDDRAVLAQLHWVRGDLNWQLANLPELPGAATRPSLRLEDTPEKYLKDTEAEYQTVLKDFADQRSAVVAAHLGLAAIAENRQDWDQAAGHYEQVNKMDEAAQWAKDLALLKLGRLGQLRRPILLATPATVPATLPATMSTTAPSTAVSPSTVPTLEAIVPVPAPSTIPSTHGVQ